MATEAHFVINRDAMFSRLEIRGDEPASILIPTAFAILWDSAPGLLSALRGLLASYDDSVGTDGGIISIADAAVAKAEGR